MAYTPTPITTLAEQEPDLTAPLLDRAALDIVLDQNAEAVGRLREIQRAAFARLDAEPLDALAAFVVGEVRAVLACHRWIGGTLAEVA